MKEKKNKDKIVSFRVDSESYKALEKMSEVSGAGTAHNFVRELAENVISRAGAVKSWSVKNEADQK